MAGAKTHQYHIVNPSIWPLVGAISALIFFAGMVRWMHDLPYGAYLIGAGALVVAFTMFSWWVDVVREAHGGDHTPIVQLHLRYGMILFIASEVMFFVAWFWAWFNAALFPASAEAVGGVWPPAHMHVMDPFGWPLLNTMILLCSGCTVTWGHAPFGFKDNIYTSAFFMATGFHGFHVIVGTIFLIVCLVRAYKGHFTPRQHFGFEAAAWYWHFVDVVWLFLFLCVYVWGGWGAAYH